MASGHLLSTLLPPASVQLGRLVLNAKCPHQDFIDPLENRPAETEFVQTIQQDFSETRKFSKTSKLRSYLSTTLSASYQVNEDSSATLSAPLVTTHDLKNSGAWFTSACTQSTTQRFLEEAFDNRANVYLIVGFRTVHNAKMVKSTTIKRSGSGKGEAPMHAGMGGIIAPGVESSKDTQNEQELNYHAAGDQVFAILYRKVKLKFMSRRKAGNMALEANNRWKSCWDWRDFDAGTDDEDEDDIVEAELTDSDLDISEDEYLSEDEVELLPEVPGPSGEEDVIQEVHQRVPENIGSVSETLLKNSGVSEVPVVADSAEYDTNHLKGGYMGTAGIEKGIETISDDLQVFTLHKGDILRAQEGTLGGWSVLFCYGILISLCCSTWFYFSGYLQL